MLALARIFLRKNKIILIDNILDHVSKPVYKQIFDIIINLSTEHTIIMISRDLKVIRNKNVNKVIFFAYGKIIGIGKHHDLIKNNLDYKKMLNNL